MIWGGCIFTLGCISFLPHLLRDFLFFFFFLLDFSKRDFPSLKGSWRDWKVVSVTFSSLSSYQQQKSHAF